MKVTDEMVKAARKAWGDHCATSATTLDDMLRAALEAALSHAAGQEVVVPEGWALVPKGASVAMCEAGAKHLADYGLGTAWADMIDAAPIAPAPASTSAEVGRDGEQCRAASEEPDAWLYEYEHDGESDHCLSRVRFLPSWVEAKRATEHPLYLRALSRGVPEGE